MLAGGMAAWLALSQSNVCPVLAEDRAAVKESPQRRTADLAKVADRLNALAKQFDADKDASLSSDEQAALLKFVGETFGQPWADRVGPFLRSADTNGNGTIEAGEWKARLRRSARHRLKSQKSRRSWSP